MLATEPLGPILRMFGHTTVVLVLLTAAYYALPLRLSPGDPASLVRLGISTVALALLLLVLRRQVERSRRAQSPRFLRIQWLLTTLYLLILAFAAAYAYIAFYNPEQFVGITDRTDALYFSVTLVATVGFGDVHASGTPAQLLVTVQMLFNLIYLGTALRLLTGGLANEPT